MHQRLDRGGCRLDCLWQLRSARSPSSLAPTAWPACAAQRPGQRRGRVRSERSAGRCATRRRRERTRRVPLVRRLDRLALQLSGQLESGARQIPRQQSPARHATMGSVSSSQESEHDSRVDAADTKHAAAATRGARRPVGRVARLVAARRVVRGARLPSGARPDDRLARRRGRLVERRDNGFGWRVDARQCDSAERLERSRGPDERRAARLEGFARTESDGPSGDATAQLPQFGGEHQPERHRRGLAGHFAHVDARARRSRESRA